MKKLISIFMGALKCSLLIIGSILLLISFRNLIFPSCVQKEIILDSPNHTYAAKSIYKTCGLMTSAGDRFVLKIYKNTLLAWPIWGKEVFAISDSSPVEVTWLGNDVLQIAGACDPVDIWTQETSYGNVTIKYLITRNYRNGRQK